MTSDYTALKRQSPPPDATPQQLWERIRVLEGMIDVPTAEKIKVLWESVAEYRGRAARAQSDWVRIRDVLLLFVTNDGNLSPAAVEQIKREYFPALIDEEAPNAE